MCDYSWRGFTNLIHPMRCQLKKEKKELDVQLLVDITQDFPLLPSFRKDSRLYHQKLNSKILLPGPLTCLRFPRENIFRPLLSLSISSLNLPLPSPLSPHLPSPLSLSFSSSHFPSLPSSRLSPLPYLMWGFLKVPLLTTHFMGYLEFIFPISIFVIHFYG